MYTFIKNLIRFGIFFYFKSVKIYGREKIPKTGSIVFIGNHPNALIDPLLLAYKNPRPPYFLTRASVFGNKYLNDFFDRIKMLPIYRPRDGKDQMYKNEAVFQKCEQILGNGNCLGVFAEGSHNIEKRIRPLKSGFARIILDTIKSFPELEDIKIIPVGLNYNNPTEALSKASVYFGGPISVREVLKNLPATEKNQINALRAEVTEKLEILSVHISGDNYDKKLKYLSQLKIDLTDPNSANSALKEFDIEKDIQIEKHPYSNDIYEKIIRMFFIATNLIPYLIWKRQKPLLKDEEFVSTFRFAICMSLVPLNLLIQCTIFFLFLPSAFVIYLGLYLLAFAYLKLSN